MLGDIELIYLVSFLWFLIVCFTDFCYFVNLSVALQTAFFPDHLLWYKVSIETNVTEICITYLRQTICWPWVLWWRQSWCGRTASSSTPWTNLPQCTVTLILTFLQCLETDLWLISVDFFGNLPPGFSTPSLLWRYISFAGVSSRTSTSGNVEKEA